MAEEACKEQKFASAEDKDMFLEFVVEVHDIQRELEAIIEDRSEFEGETALADDTVHKLLEALRKEIKNVVGTGALTVGFEVGEAGWDGVGWGGVGWGGMGSMRACLLRCG